MLIFPLSICTKAGIMIRRVNLLFCPQMIQVRSIVTPSLGELKLIECKVRRKSLTVWHSWGD